MSLLTLYFSRVLIKYRFIFVFGWFQVIFKSLPMSTPTMNDVVGKTKNLTIDSSEFGALVNLKSENDAGVSMDNEVTVSLSLQYHTSISQIKFSQRPKQHSLWHYLCFSHLKTRFLHFLMTTTNNITIIPTPKKRLISGD